MRAICAGLQTRCFASGVLSTQLTQGLWRHHWWSSSSSLSSSNGASSARQGEGFCCGLLPPSTSQQTSPKCSSRSRSQILCCRTHRSLACWSSWQHRQCQAQGLLLRLRLQQLQALVPQMVLLWALAWRQGPCWAVSR